LDGTPAALWLWLTQGCTNSAYRHTFLRGQSAPTTTPLLQGYKQSLESRGLTLADNCLRTWFFVKDIDHNYQELVESRKAFFLNEGLTPQTHYIASTGINGNPLCPTDIVQMEAYTVEGLHPEQVQYLKGSSHLNPTSEYGVTFERGTLMQYGDRNHVYISGTASINNHGEVLHVGNVQQQTLRMWENVEALLGEGGMTYDDVMQIVVYLRDCADFQIVKQMFDEKFPRMPIVFTLAPVCRPTWLIEMECMAVKQANNTFRDF
jgi:enamine deaminase RidA (YjgF/YER057c/UK114 family)